MIKALWFLFRNQFWHRLPYGGVLGWRLNAYEFAPVLSFSVRCKEGESWGHVLPLHDRGWLIPRRVHWPRRIALRRQ